MKNEVRRNFIVAALLVLALPLAGCNLLKGGGSPKTPTIGARISILSNDASVTVDPTLSQQIIILPSPVSNANWPQSGGNASKVMSHVALSSGRNQIWQASITGSTTKRRLAASPVVSDNRLIAVGTDAVVSAFAADTGALLWKTAIGSPGRDFEASLFGGGAAIDGDFVYVTSGVGDIAALAMRDGSILWKVQPTGPLRSPPTLAFGGVYVISQDNQIIALNASDGTILWQAVASQEAGNIFGAGSPAAGQGTIVAGYSSGELQAYRYENGRELWDDTLARTSMALSVSTLTDVDASPVIDRGRIFALGQGGRMASYDLLTGQRIWEISIAGISTPWLAGEWVYVLSDDAKLLCVARATGKIRWVTQLQKYKNEKKKKNQIRWTGPVLAGEKLIVANTEGSITEISPNDGSVISARQLSASVTHSPIVANNTLYILADDGVITAWQ